MSITTYTWPRIAPRSKLYTLKANGQPVTVLYTNVADFATFECDGEVTIEVSVIEPASMPLKGVKVRPLSRNIAASLDGMSFSFKLAGPSNLMIDVEGHKPLLLYANPPETANPGEKPGVRYFKAGQVYEVGELVLEKNEHLYIEGGAFVRGVIRSLESENVVLAGRGIIDGGYYQGERGRRTVLLDACRGATIRDLIVINPTTWMTLLGGCDDVRVQNYHEIGECVGSDGVDIVGSRNVLIEGCCLKNNDDCVVVKAFDPRHWNPDVRGNWCRDVENVLVQNCVFMNDRAGNVIEIGHELRTDTIRNITFHDCDCLHCHGSGAVFSIHAGDRATVRDILFENIRVEHYWDNLVDFRVMKSQFNRDEQRGQIRNVTLRNITVHQANYNPGYSMSVIGGWDKDHTVDGVMFENFILGGRKLSNADELDLHTKHAHNIIFR